MSELAGDPWAASLKRLSAAGVRPTVACIAVLQVLEAVAPKRLDVDTLFQALLERGTNIKRVTIYRALKKLADHGLLMHEWRNGISGPKAVYGLLSPGASAEITCRHCGSAVAVGDASLYSQLQRLALEQGLDLATEPMTILAMCKQCAK